ncbi:hypothetical protein ACP70R_014500 [Stipagrostis hirtigluma subsp. patula]
MAMRVLVRKLSVAATDALKRASAPSVSPAAQSRHLASHSPQALQSKSLWQNLKKKISYFGSWALDEIVILEEGNSENPILGCFRQWKSQHSSKGYQKWSRVRLKDLEILNKDGTKNDRLTLKDLERLHEETARDYEKAIRFINNMSKYDAMSTGGCILIVTSAVAYLCGVSDGRRKFTA